MNPMNWNSVTGRKPCAARPTDMPASTVSASGVSITRFSPKRAIRPSVARNTPPLAPTSSPSTTTRGSSCRARASAIVIAATMVISAMSAARIFLALPLERMRQRFKQMIEHRSRRRGWEREIFRHGGVDFFPACGDKLLFVLLRPPMLVDEIGSRPRQRIELPCGADQFLLAITRCVVRRGVVAHAVGQRFDHARSASAARPLHGLARHLARGDDVVAVDLDARDAGGDRLLRQGLCRGLLLARHGDGPIIVDHHENDWQPPRASKVDRFVEVAFRSGAITQGAHGNAPFMPQ